MRILSIVDVYTRECLALEADTSLGTGRVIRVLERLLLERGAPENVRSDVAGSIFTGVPSGDLFNERLNAVSRIRVANIGGLRTERWL